MAVRIEREDIITDENTHISAKHFLSLLLNHHLRFFRFLQAVLPPVERKMILYVTERTTPDPHPRAKKCRNPKL